MSLLSRLREEADQLRLERTGSAEALAVRRDRVERAMRAVPAYFDEVKEHLETLLPPSPRRYVLEALTIEKLRLGEFYFNSRLRQVLEREVYDYHIFSFAYRSEQQLDLMRNSRFEIDQLEKLLHTARIPFDLALSRDSDHRIVAGRFKFDLKFRGGVRFQADPEEGTVAVLFRNVDRLDAFELEFVPEEVNEALFDRIVGFILGENESHTLGGQVRFRKPARVYAREEVKSDNNGVVSPSAPSDAGA
ncbi:MAG: hypothetical protein HYZ17_14390 [Betaproteobacteria bacterium]|nr:hypothetical protein [Betaproteobacteria bacterium]